MILKIIFVIGLVTMADSRRLNFSGSSEESSESIEDDSSSYELGRLAARNGGDAEGSHYVLLPDGRVQQVVLSAIGDGGRKAEIAYVGEAFFPESAESEESNELVDSDELGDSDESSESREFFPPQTNRF